MSLLASTHPKRRGILSRVVVAIAAVAIAAVPALVVASPAAAASASVVLTPATATAESNVATTFTMDITCNGPGVCTDTVVSFPTNVVTGNGANTNMATWIGASSCADVTRSIVGNEVRFTYAGSIDPGVKRCTFDVRAPEYTTFNNAQATLTPTISGSTFTSSTGAPAVLTVTAGHNASLAKAAPAQVIIGTQFTYQIRFICGTNAQYDGDIGMSAIRIEDVLPANFVFASYTTRNTPPAGTVITAPSVGQSGGTFVYNDPTGATCGNPPLNINNQMIINITGTISGAVGATACNTATTTFTYLDGVAGSGTATTSPCPTLVELNTVVGKGVITSTMGNAGQYLYGGAPRAYTFPGNWDQSGNSVSYTLTARANPATLNAGLSYLIRDSIPCLTNLSGTAYLSNATGTLCQSPAFIPTRITPSGFTATAGDAITVTFADGSTQSIPFASGGWTFPAPSTGGGVAEIEIPPFAGEANNTATSIQFTVAGYASASAAPGNALRNTMSSTPYMDGSPVGTAQTSLADFVQIVNPQNGTGQPGSTIVTPAITATYTSACNTNVSWTAGSVNQTRNTFEITKAPSEAMYFDYLAPAGATLTSTASKTFQLIGLTNGQTFTSGSITATQTANYNGTGRTLYQWVVPAGLVTVPGVYRVHSAAMTVNLGPGCAGVYQNDITTGYGASVVRCILGSSATVPPLYPSGNANLRANGSPIANNYCGYSSPVTVAATGQQYSVLKTVQGNLDPAPVTSPTLGHVSPTGGQATYNVTFRNNGLANLNDPIMYDMLPRVGDTWSSDLSTPRGSQFNVALLSVGTIPANTTVAYSTATNPCRPELIPTNPGCVNDWTTTPPTPLSATTGIRIAYSGTVGVAGSAFPTSFSLAYTVSTPNSTSGSIAYNSVGTNVIAGTEYMGRAESDRVGLQAAENQPEITKSANVTEYDAVGDTITYTFVVTNNTTVALTSVGVTDQITDAAPGAVAPAATCVSRTSPAAACSGATTTLAAGQSANFTATYTVRQADIDHGSISDIGQSAGTPPTGGALSGTSNTVTVNAVQDPAISVVKSATPTLVDTVGDVIDYEFVITNDGNTTLTNLGITETAFSGSGSMSSVTCPTAPLAPTQSATCTATYSVTQDDLTAGVIDNTAFATATSGSTALESDESSASVDVDQTPSLLLVKSASPSAEASYNAGQLITYSFAVTNTGNIPVTGLAISELDFTGTGTVSAITCPVTTLAPAAQTTCTATYTLTQDDVDASILQNTAEATGTTVAGSVTSNESSAATPQVADASLSLTKTANTAFVNGADEVITYTFAVRNNGNVTIHGIAIDETEFTGTGTEPTITCPTTTLIPGGLVNCTATYTVLQDDIDQRTIENTAVATGLDPSDEEVTSPESDWTITANIDASLELLKTANLTGIAEVDQVVEYSFLVTNTGNITVDGVDINEVSFTGDGDLSAIDCPAGPVAPTDSVTCTAEYQVTQTDLDNGGIDNTATAFATPVGDDTPVVSEESTVELPAVQEPAATLVKSVTPTTADAEGDVVSYSFLVTNTGNMTLTDVAIDETVFSGSDGAPIVTCPAGPLAPGDDITCTASYVLTQADVDAGVVDNTAIATATAGTIDVESEESSASVDIERTASLSLVKSAEPADPEVLFEGDTITYSFVVTNTGNVTITNPTVTETEFTGTGTLPDPTCDATTSLAPGDQFTCQIVYTLTQEDVDAGTLSNTAQADGTAPTGTTPLTPPTDTVAIPSPAAPGLELVKETTTEKLTSVGQIVTYTFTVTNTGNTTISGLAISEDEFDGNGELSAVDCPTTTILPGQVVVCEAVYLTVAADMDGTELSNTATATGNSAGGEAVVSDASSVVISDVADLRPPLAFTGATVLWGAGTAALALLALGGGLFLMVALRRRQQDAQ